MGKDYWLNELFVENDVVKGKPLKYMYISENDIYRVNAIYAYLLQNDIYIQGFVSDNQELINHRIRNKKVYGRQQIGKDAMLITTPSSIGDTYTPIEIVNPIIDDKEVIIYGAGVNGKIAYGFLKQAGIEVKCFIDKNSESKAYDNINIYGLDALSKVNKNTVIVEALRDWREVEEQLCKLNIKLLHFSIEERNQTNLYTNQGEKVIDLDCPPILDVFRGKKIFIYGINEKAKCLAKWFSLMDYDFVGFLVDSESEYDIAKHDSVRLVEEILYVKDYYIYIENNNLEFSCDKLVSLGLNYLIDFSGPRICGDIINRKKTILDVNLGYTFVQSEKYPGYMVYGNEAESDYKMVVLGGSTTDGAAFAFKSWSELLYEKMNNRNLTIYNGGVFGYKSAHELLKLVRDAINLKPNMIISYSGVNDLYSGEYPFSAGYTLQIFDFARRNLEDAFDENSCRVQTNLKNDFVVQGIKTEEDSFGTWLRNERCMYAICKEFNIEFYGFCQPILLSKENKNELEEDMEIEFIENAKVPDASFDFRKLMKERAVEERYSYIRDLSGIFDNVQGVYLDVCHVSEYGNKLIADAIYKEICTNTTLAYENIE